MSAMSAGLRWFGTLLVDAADVLEVPAPERAADKVERGLEVEEELRRMRSRIQGRYHY
jgi:hypothetical protein